MTCLITGCDIVDVVKGCSARGDLHGFDGVFIFVAVANQQDNETAWEYGRELDPIHLNAHNFFEKRGLIVMRWHDDFLSPAAMEYVHKWSPQIFTGEQHGK